MLLNLCVDKEYCKCECLSKRHKLFAVWDMLKEDIFFITESDTFTFYKMLGRDTTDFFIVPSAVSVLGIYSINTGKNTSMVYVSCTRSNIEIVEGNRVNLVFEVENNKVLQGYAYFTMSPHLEGEPCTQCLNDNDHDERIDFVQMLKRYEVDTIFYLNFLEGKKIKKDSGFRTVWNYDEGGYSIMLKRNARQKPRKK